MSKRSRDTDPMGQVVDRLLAQLSGTPSGPRSRWAPARNGLRPRPSVVVGSARDDEAPHGSATIEVVGLWARVSLVLLLGALMTQWPYPHECGVRLLAYTGAVLVMLVGGGWIGFVSWRRRNGIAHLLALVLAFWGMVLAAEALLPRIGYAAERAVWSCGSVAERP